MEKILNEVIQSGLLISNVKPFDNPFEFAKYCMVEYHDRILNLRTILNDTPEITKINFEYSDFVIESFKEHDRNVTAIESIETEGAIRYFDNTNRYNQFFFTLLVRTFPYYKFVHIHSVKRISDGAVFTKGETIKCINKIVTLTSFSSSKNDDGFMELTVGADFGNIFSVINAIEKI